LDDVRAIQETSTLVSIPEMRASIRKGLTTMVKECLESLGWYAAGAAALRAGRQRCKGVEPVRP
jgi:hypothetical protein